MTDLRLEVWDRLGTAGFGPKMTLDTIQDSARLQPVNGIGEGRCTLDDGFRHPELVLTTDPANTANNVRSLVRVYLDGDISGVTQPYAEWMPEQLIPPSDSESGRFEMMGEGRESMVKDAVVLPWDWDGNQIWQSFWPDWIYGGPDVVGPVEVTFKPHIIDAWIDAGATGTATIGVSIDGAAYQDATVAPGDNSFVVKAAFEALAYGMTVDVQGAGTVNTPWQIRFQDPPGVYQISISSGGLSGGRIFFNQVQYGVLLPVGWTESRLDATTITHGQLSGSLRASLGGGADPALPAGCSAWIWFNGEEYQTPGVQYITRVIPGGIYWSPPIYLYSKGVASLVRVVLRDLNENILYDPAGNEAFEEITIPANTLTLTAGIGAVVIPEGVYEIVYRIGHIGVGNPPDIGVACPSLTEGFPASNIGVVVTDLWTDWTSNHAASPWPISYWVHGDGGFYLALDFDGTNDSNGNAWPRDESITLKRGERFDKVLAKIVALGYEWRIVPAPVDGYYLLQIVPTGTFGIWVDYSALDTPTIRGGRDVTKRALRRWLSKTASMVEGAEMFFAFGGDAGAQAGWGVSSDYSVQLDFDGDTVQQAATERVTDQLRRTRSLVINLVDVGDPLIPIPGRSYVAGDTLRVIDPPTIPDQAERVWSIQYAHDDGTITWEVQMGNQSFSAGK